MSISALPLPQTAVRTARSRRSILVAGASLGLSGLLFVVAGTFLPWLTSGGVERNSYAVLGIVRRLRVLGGGPAATAISLWPLLGAMAMVPVLAGILRRWRTAAAAALVFGLLTGVGGALVLAVAGGHRAAGIAVNSTGPVVTVAGAVLAVLGAVLTRAVVRRGRTAHQPPPAIRPSSPPSTGVAFHRASHIVGESSRPPLEPQHLAHSIRAVATERDAG